LATSVDISTEQLRLMEELQRTLVQVRENTSAIANNMQSMGAQSQSFQQLNQAATDASGAMKDLGGQASSTLTLFERIGKFFDELPDKIGNTIFGEKGYSVFKGFVSKIKTGFDLLTTNIGTFYDAIMGPAAGVFGFIGTVYDELIAKASELAQASLDYARALEEVRDKFGSFNETTSRTIKSTAEGLSSSLKEAAGGAGVFGSKFSPGVQGSIERLQAMEGIVSSLGATFNALGEESIKDAAAELFVLNKGLNFSAEAMKQTAVLAQLNGTSLKTFSQNIMESVDKIGRRFNISTKVLGQDVGKALSNFKLLGKMTGDYVVEMTKAAAFTRKLGIEIESLTGLVDKFDEFEGGAEAAAQLAQGFGMVLDPIKMMNMQNPAGRLQELQRAFTATGRSFESMTRQERNLLVQTSGLNDEQAALAFSSKGLSMSYDEIQKGADGAMKKQKSTEEVMRDLADNIKNVVVGFQTFTGFIDAFIKGILQGIGLSGNFQSIIRDLAKGMTTVYHIGLGIGKVLSSIFLAGGSDKAKKWSDMFVNIAKQISFFVKNFDNANETLPQKIKALFTNIWNIVSDTMEGFWNEIKSFGSMQRLDEVGAVIVELMTGALDWAVDTLAPEFINFLDRLFLPEGAAGSGPPSKFGESLNEMFSEERMKKLDVVFDRVVDSLANMLSRAIDKYPWASALSGLLVAGGPLATIVSGIFSEAGNLFAAEGAKIADAATAPLAAAASSDMASGSLTGMATSMLSGLGGFFTGTTPALETLANIIAKPAAIAATGSAIAWGIESLGEALQNVIRGFMESPGEGKPSIIELLRTSIKTFDSVDNSSILKFGEVVGGMGVAIGSIIGGIAFFASKISEKGGLISMVIGGGAGLMVAGLALFGPPGGDSLITALNSIIGNIVSSLADFFTNSTNIDNIKRLENASPTIDLLKASAEKVKSAVGSIVAITDALPRNFFGKIDLPSLVTDSLSLKNLLSGDFVKNIANIDIGPDGAGKLKNLVESKGLFNLSEIFKDINNMIQVAPDSGKIADLRTSFLILGNASFKDAINGAMSALVDISETMGPGQSLMSDPFEIMRSLFVDKLQPMVESLNKIGGPGGIVAAGTSIAMLPWLMGTLQASANSIGSTLNQSFNFETPENGFNYFNSLSSYLGDVTDHIKVLEDTSLQSGVDALNKITERLTGVRQIIENLPELKLDALIEETKDNMNVANKSFSIAGGAVKIQVQMNVNMNAMKLAGELVMNGYVKPTDEFNKYLLPPENQTRQNMLPGIETLASKYANAEEF